MKKKKIKTGRLKYFLVQESSPSLYRSTQPLTNCEYESHTKEAKSVSESFAKGWNDWRGRGEGSHCTWHSPLFAKVRVLQLSPYHKFSPFPSLRCSSNSTAHHVKTHSVLLDVERRQWRRCNTTRREAVSPSEWWPRSSVQMEVKEDNFVFFF